MRFSALYRQEILLPQVGGNRVTLLIDCEMTPVFRQDLS